MIYFASSSITMRFTAITFLCAICETASAMAQPLAPEVRSQFAKRLEEHADAARVRPRALLRQVARHRGEPLYALRARRGRAEPHAHSQDVRDPAGVAQRAAWVCARLGRLCRRARARRGAAGRDQARAAAQEARMRQSGLACLEPGGGGGCASAKSMRGKSKAAGDPVRDDCARPARCFARLQARSLRHGGRDSPTMRAEERRFASARQAWRS